MPRDYAQAAVRNYRDAERLAAAGRHDSAGHLIGLAAECCIKKFAGGFTRPPNTEIDGHLPQVKREIRLILQGRNITGPLLQLVSRSEFFSDWHINDRYEEDGYVDQTRYERWRDQAKQALSAARLRY
jgi:HEPN domain-containing protein